MRLNTVKIGMLVRKLNHRRAAAMIFANCQSVKVVADKHPNAVALCLNAFLIDSEVWKLLTSDQSI